MQFPHCAHPSGTFCQFIDHLTFFSNAIWIIGNPLNSRKNLTSLYYALLLVKILEVPKSFMKEADAEVAVHSVEIWEFFCHPVFSWNQSWWFLRPQKRPYLIARKNERIFFQISTLRFVKCVHRLFTQASVTNAILPSAAIPYFL